MAQPLINRQCIIKKIPGKGGWHYVEVPEIKQDKQQPFGWVQVKGCIDDFVLQQYKLMPMGNGHLFLPLRAEIRKQLRKGEGDWVQVVLYADDSALVIPDEFLLCLQDAPQAHRVFFAFPQYAQKDYVDWIYAAKTIDTRVRRITAAIRKLELGLKRHEKGEGENEK